MTRWLKDYTQIIKESIMTNVRLSHVREGFRRICRRAPTVRNRKILRLLIQYCEKWGEDILIYDDRNMREAYAEYLAEKHCQPLAHVKDRMNKFRAWAKRVSYVKKADSDRVAD